MDGLVPGSSGVPVRLTRFFGRETEVAELQEAVERDRFLIHARLVLMHLPERKAVVDKLAGALRPGGWLVVEDYDGRTFGVTHPTPTGAAGWRAPSGPLA